MRKQKVEKAVEEEDDLVLCSLTVGNEIKKRRKQKRQ